MNTAFRLTENHLGELDSIALLDNIAYVIGSPAWTRVKELERSGLVALVSQQNIIGYEATECFEITAKGRRILKGTSA